MADLEQQKAAQTPLLHPHEEPEQFTHLSQAIKNLQTFLYLMGFHQTSLLSFSLSWTGFLIVGVLIPVLIIEFNKCSSCSKNHISKFDFHILAFQAFLAAVSLYCISHILRKTGIYKFLFVDQGYAHVARFHNKYAAKIQDFFRLLILCTSPCFFLKIALELTRNVYVHDSFLKSIAITLASIISWTYLTVISLSACLLFSLVCTLQIIRFDDYGKLLETDSDFLEFLKEHMMLRHHLSKISHRFRIYLLLEFLLVTASQLFTLFQTIEDHRIINLISGADFAVISIAQLVGIVLSLHAAAKFSHKAQSIASVASRWHALVTCGYNDTSPSIISNNIENIKDDKPVEQVAPNFSESDSDSVEPIVFHTNIQMPSYHRRQSLVVYLQSNLGGVTVFGWRIDRALINTMFLIELSLVNFVLGKTLVFTTK